MFHHKWRYYFGFKFLVDNYQPHISNFSKIGGFVVIRDKMSLKSRVACLHFAINACFNMGTLVSLIPVCYINVSYKVVLLYALFTGMLALWKCYLWLIHVGIMAYNNLFQWPVVFFGNGENLFYEAF